MTVEWDELSGYLAGELDPDREAALERELFEDPHSTEVPRFLAVVDGIAALRGHHGTMSGVLPPGELAGLRARATLLELTLPRSGILDWHVSEDIDICIAKLAVDLEGVGTLDLELVDGTGQTYARFHDVPADRARGEVLVACERHVALREEVTVFRLVTHGPEGRRVLGDYGVRNAPPPS